MSEDKQPKIKAKSIDPEAAKAVLQAENEQRAAACKKAIEKVLKEYRCDMQVGVFVTAGGNIPQINIVAKN